ncbi:dihydroorotate dehydrogenase electron transfer subunit [Methanobrevibacter sp.]|uniref:dihydroorotate dehydrogenase electron transfer subunit n=1 Tax=Methanobrevibacter sp. TaxID=66852 RepID=UPI0025CBAA3E|nr:dihydroorotate dehydrogenase electron transfer subunit [Methanobrevibacter sp.]MBQ2665681.1 dihydroorotate dehydrogenase electron transfer subunit [Methanobrevibacter sp.]
MINEPKIVEIKEIITETPTIKTFKFNWDFDKLGKPNPGEFLMIWNFKNEKPMSISQINDDELAITVKNIGEFTSQLHELEAGDLIGVRGSYGNGFDNTFKDKRIIAIGGGVGMAPVNAIATDLAKSNEVEVISAAQTKDELLFIDSLEKSGVDVHACTDDGSFGFKGFATDCLSGLLESSTYDYAFVCGPEIMMKGIFEILESSSIPGQYSLERYMKCALGVCGQCCVDSEGWRICVEGPVFENDKIEKITEFAKYRRDASGVKY